MLVRGPIDTERLNAAFATVVERHEILRTAFQSVPGMALPTQAVNAARAPQWRRIDLRLLPPQIQDRQTIELAAADRDTPFDLEHGPIVRPLLIDLDTDRRRFVLTAPAIALDSRSLINLAAEVATLLDDSAATLDPEPLQCVQIAEWQDDLLEAEDPHALEGRAFWSRQISDANDPGALPLRRAADSAGDEWASLPLDLSPAQIDAVSRLATQSGVTDAIVLETLWAVLIARFTANTQLTLGHECEGRSYPELENALGHFAKTLPLHLPLDALTPLHLSFRELAALLREALSWEEYFNPDLGAPESRLRYGFRYADRSATQIPARFTIETVCSDAESFDLALEVCKHRAGLQLEIRYDGHRAVEAEVRRLAEHYRALLDAASEHPNAPIGALNTLPADERQRLLVEWNCTERQFPVVSAIHTLFEQAVQRMPEAAAVICEDGQRSYDQLNRQANRLAHHLRALGVGPDMPVGLCLERSPDLIVGLLGILKAGGAYLPLDPVLPAERRAWMLSDSGARLLVSRQGLLDLDVPDVQTVLLDRDEARIAAQSEIDLDNRVGGEHLAYVIYTSGSTGRPKGVCIEHRNLLNYVQGVMERLDLPAGAHFATVSTIAADLGNTALFPALCGGGCLHVMSRERAQDPTLWREYLEKYPIDCLKIVPSHLAALLGTGDVSAAMLPGQVLVLGGEASGWELVERVRQASPALRILNHYGPTETTVGVLTYEVEAGLSPASAGTTTVPLGRPLPNSRLYVLNSALEPLPVGVVGEITIGGAGVGRGYLNDAERTAERFVRDPFTTEPDARLYRTGDLGRFLADGNIEFLGRMDNQVKIRGFRIELGEIESVLARHPAVREAVVLVREDVPGERRLVAYIVFHAEAISAGELREAAGRMLPDYMVPTAFVTLKRLPLTLNGKVDRKALPAPGDESEQGDYVAPRTPVEEAMAGIWGALLGREQMSVEDNFFDLGGHSLLATQVISRVRETFQVDVPLQALFELPTIAGLAAAVDRAQSDRDQENDAELASLLAELEQLSDEEAQALLNRQPNDPNDSHDERNALYDKASERGEPSAGIGAHNAESQG
jgi:amino acid adenylation domain-containing protein